MRARLYEGFIDSFLFAVSITCVVTNYYLKNSIYLECHRYEEELPSKIRLVKDTSILLYGRTSASSLVPSAYDRRQPPRWLRFEVFRRCNVKAEHGDPKKEIEPTGRDCNCHAVSCVNDVFAGHVHVFAEIHHRIKKATRQSS